MRIIRAEGKGPKVPGLTAQERSVQSAIEKSLSRYIHLKCEHYTTPDMQLLYAFGKPKGRVFWCDVCSRWVQQMPRPKPVKYPETPLF